jgi:N-acetylneuraminic acid mutarotase
MLQRKLQNVFLIVALTILGLLVNVSTSLAQGGSWIQMTDIPTARLMASSCELNGKIYVIGGGKTLVSSLNTMEVYDPVTDTWDTTKADMLTARVELCVAVVNGKIYAIGGSPFHNGGTALGMVEEYDPLTDSWITKSPMLTARKGAACGVINNKIYIAGGSASVYVGSNILEVYDPATDTWTSGAIMLAARYVPQGAVLNDTFYVSGGLIGYSPWTGQKTVQRYDPIGDSWSYGTPLIHGRVGHTTDAINGRIYAIAGTTQPPDLENVEEYDPQTETWAVTDTTPSAMVTHTSSFYSNKIYVFSGYFGPMNNLTLIDNVNSYDLITSIEPQKNLTPDVFTLHQNYPNPFNPTTNIEFSIPEAEFVTLKIFNLLGQEVSTLVSDKLKSGTYQYTWDAGSLASGVYLYHIQAGEYVEVRKMVLMK